jgi:DNA-binding NarL/FixJ family response regulator
MRGTVDIEEEPVLSAIYGAALEPHRWGEALQATAQALGATSAFMFSSHSDTEPGAVLQTYGTSGEMVEGFANHWHEQDEWMLAAQRTGRTGGGTVVLGHELVPREQFRRTAFGNDFCRPHEMMEMLGSVLFDGSEPDAMPFVNLCWYRPERDAHFESDHKAAVRRVVPHFQRALRIQRRVTAARHEALADNLGAMRMAALVLDARGAVCSSNARGAQLLASLPAASFRFGVLRTLGARCQPQVHEAIAACKPAHPVTIVALWTEPHRVVDATLVALGGGRYLLTARLPRTDGGAAAKAVQGLFKLTQAEVRVLGLLLDGLAPRDIAQQSGTSMATVRSQIASLYGKTGTTGQTELVLLLDGLGTAAPVAR